jgi:hypothetical protein
MFKKHVPDAWGLERLVLLVSVGWKAGGNAPVDTVVQNKGVQQRKNLNIHASLSCTMAVHNTTVCEEQGHYKRDILLFPFQDILTSTAHKTKRTSHNYLRFPAVFVVAESCCILILGCTRLLPAITPPRTHRHFYLVVVSKCM